VTEAGSGVVSEQRNRLVATIKFIYAGTQITKGKRERKKGVVSEQRKRLVATIKFIYAGIQITKGKRKRKKGDCKQNPE